MRSATGSPTLNPKGDPVLMLAGHMDELGLIVTFVNKDGFLYFDTIGGTISA